MSASTEGVNIGEAARRSGVSAKMIRHYESLGLLPAADRNAVGWRRYRDADVHVLRFVHRARGLGFDLKTIDALLRLWHDKDRASADVKRLAREHVAALDAKITQLQQMKRVLAHLAACCHGDDRPDCPILDRLADDTPDE